MFCFWDYYSDSDCNDTSATATASVDAIFASFSMTKKYPEALYTRTRILAHRDYMCAKNNPL